MKIPYKVYPASTDPGYNGMPQTWMPMVPVALLVGHTRSKRFDALIDSGVHSGVGRSIGLNVETGELGQLHGVVAGAIARVYYHQVRLCLERNIGR